MNSSIFLPSVPWFVGVDHAFVLAGHGQQMTYLSSSQSGFHIRLRMPIAVHTAISVMPP
ncbi:hypothetical protein [Streptomyces sp. NPDC087294]|uniref:hypothetical protein n=1 Tax=Streptomyces sp. NPDC087294 TaxID=3365777 RepID=UPI0038026FF9